MRINTDTPPNELVAPHWNMQKGQMRERLIRYMEMMDFRQGDLYEQALDQPRPQVRLGLVSKVCKTLYDSFTLMDSNTGEPYHPRVRAIKSCRDRFIGPAQIQTALAKK